MLKNSSNINKINNHLSFKIIERTLKKLHMVLAGLPRELLGPRAKDNRYLSRHFPFLILEVFFLDISIVILKLYFFLVSQIVLIYLLHLVPIILFQTWRGHTFHHHFPLHTNILLLSSVSLHYILVHYCIR
jgi:hypothetical protein